MHDRFQKHKPFFIRSIHSPPTKAEASMVSSSVYIIYAFQINFSHFDFSFTYCFAKKTAIYTLTLWSVVVGKITLIFVLGDWLLFSSRVYLFSLNWWFRFYSLCCHYGIAMGKQINFQKNCSIFSKTAKVDHQWLHQLQNIKYRIKFEESSKKKFRKNYTKKWNLQMLKNKLLH